MKIVIDTDVIKKGVSEKAKSVKEAGSKAIHSAKAHAENLASLNNRRVVECPHCGHDHSV